MEDLDSLAGGVAYKHLMEPGVSKLTGSVAERGFYVVTASVDRRVRYTLCLAARLTLSKTGYAHHSDAYKRQRSTTQRSSNIHRQKLDGDCRKMGSVGPGSL